MGVLDGMVIVEGEAAVLVVNVGHPIVTNGDFVALLRESDAFISNCFGGGLVIIAGRMVSSGRSVSDFTSQWLGFFVGNAIFLSSYNRIDL